MKRPNYVFDDELYHWGIPGQRWGHRRYQNEDGSLTPEGREHYGYGDERRAAKEEYKTQKYKAKLESRAIKDAARRAAKEERYKIRQAAKVESAAKKEQSKLNREQSKLNNKLNRDQAKENDTTSIKNVFNRTKKYTMSDDELTKAIDRLKLEVEYNKQYALAAKPNGALARADRFFSGPTGQFVKDIAVQTIPKVAETATKQILENKLKYANKEDRDKINADIEKVKSEIRAKDAETKQKEAGVESTKAKIAREDAETKAKIARENAETQAKIKNDRGTTLAGILSSRRASKSAAADAESKRNIESANAESQRKINEARELGYTDRFNNYHTGNIANKALKAQESVIKGARNQERIEAVDQYIAAAHATGKISTEDLMKYINSMGKKKKKK